MITKKQLLTQFSQVQIAALFGITKAAVNQWDDDLPINLKYEYVFRHGEHNQLWHEFNAQNQANNKEAV